MKKLIIKSQLSFLLATEGEEVSKHEENEFILDGDIIRKDPLFENDPLYINILSEDGNDVRTFVKSEASEINKTNQKTARIWREIRK